MTTPRMTTLIENLTNTQEVAQILRNIVDVSFYNKDNLFFEKE